LTYRFRSYDLVLTKPASITSDNLNREQLYIQDSNTERIKPRDLKEEKKEKFEHQAFALWFGEISTAGNNTLRCTLGRRKKTRSKHRLVVADCVESLSECGAQRR